MYNLGGATVKLIQPFQLHTRLEILACHGQINLSTSGQ